MKRVEWYVQVHDHIEDVRRVEDTTANLLPSHASAIDSGSNSAV
jgi:hypothetical protein